MAGHETTAGTLTWAMVELTRHPTALQRLVQEVDEMYEACNGAVDSDAIGKLKYMTQVLKAP